MNFNESKKEMMNENMIYLENETSSAGEMPRGDMNQSIIGTGSQMSEAAGEMPLGTMIDSPVGFSGQTSSAGEMPRGDMNQSTSNDSLAENQLKTIDLSGSWKLQLTIN